MCPPFSCAAAAGRLGAASLPARPGALVHQDFAAPFTLFGRERGQILAQIRAKCHAPANRRACRNRVDPARDSGERGALPTGVAAAALSELDGGLTPARLRNMGYSAVMLSSNAFLYVLLKECTKGMGKMALSKMARGQSDARTSTIFALSSVALVCVPIFFIYMLVSPLMLFKPDLVFILSHSRPVSTASAGWSFSRSSTSSSWWR